MGIKANMADKTPTAKMKLISLICLSIILTSAYAGIPWQAEYGSDRSYFPTIHQQLLDQTAQHGAEVKEIFLGDSITWMWTQPNEGDTIFAQSYSPRGTFNYGLPGDRTEHVLWRLENGEFDGLDNAKLVVLMIGTNNIGNNPPADIARGVQEIINHIQAKLPSAKTLILGVLPRDGAYQEDLVTQLNSLTSQFADNSKVFYLDMSSSFQTSPGAQIQGLYNSDKIHLSPQGYQVWHDAMEPTFAQLIG